MNEIKEMNMNSNVKNIVKPNFSGKLGRADYFLSNMVVVGAYFAGAVIFGGSFGLVENFLVEGSTVANVLSFVLVATMVTAIFWTSYASISLAVKRFRDCGVTNTGTLTVTTVAYFGTNAVFPLVFFIPLLYPGKKES